MDAHEERDQRGDRKQEDEHAERALFERIDDGAKGNLGFVGEFGNLAQDIGRRSVECINAARGRVVVLGRAARDFFHDRVIGIMVVFCVGKARHSCSAREDPCCPDWPGSRDLSGTLWTMAGRRNHIPNRGLRLCRRSVKRVTALVTRW